jgi:hypothetical protein
MVAATDAGTHSPERVLDAQGRAQHVDLEHAPEVGGLDVDEQAGDLDPGVVDQDVQAAEGADGLRHGLVPARLASHVQRHELADRAGLAQRVGGLLAQLLLDVGDDDGRPGPGQGFRHAVAEPAGPAGDQCLPPRQFVHAHQAPLPGTAMGP